MSGAVLSGVAGGLAGPGDCGASGWDCNNILIRPSLVLLWLVVGPGLERLAMTVPRLGGREEETGREEGGRGVLGNCWGGIGEFRLGVGRNN